MKLSYSVASSTNDNPGAWVDVVYFVRSGHVSGHPQSLTWHFLEKVGNCQRQWVQPRVFVRTIEVTEIDKSDLAHVRFNLDTGSCFELQRHRFEYTISGNKKVK